MSSEPKFKEFLNNSREIYIELFILDFINECAPNFVHYRVLEMIDEGGFDDDMAVTGHFKRILWPEVMT